MTQQADMWKKTYTFPYNNNSWIIEPGQRLILHLHIRLLLILALLSYSPKSISQNHKQYIKGTINELNTGRKPVYPVQISSEVSSAIINETTGNFELEITKVEPGARVRLNISYTHPITKEKWSVVNEQDCQVIIQGDLDSQFVRLYMCSPAKIEEQILSYYLGTRRNIIKRYESRIRQLSKKNLNYEHEMAQLTSEKEQSLSLAHDYARKYATTDIAEMTITQHKARDFIKQGQLRMATDLLNKENADSAAKETRNELDRQFQIKDVANNNIRELKSKLGSLIKTIIQEAELFELQYDEELAEKKYKTALKLDSTASHTILQYAALKIRQQKIIEGMNLLKSCLKTATSSIDSFYAYSNLGTSHEIFREFDSAFIYFDLSTDMFINSTARFTHSDSAAVIQMSLEQAYLYLEKGDSNAFKKHFNLADTIIAIFDLTDTSSRFKILKTMQLSVKGDFALFHNNDTQLAERFYNAALIFAEKAQSNETRTSHIDNQFVLAKTFRRLGGLSEQKKLYYDAEQFYLKACEIIDTLCLHNPAVYEIENINNYLALAYSFLRGKEPAKARKYFKHCFEHCYKFSNASLRPINGILALLYYQLGISEIQDVGLSAFVSKFEQSGSLKYLDSCIFFYESDSALKKRNLDTLGLACFEIGQFRMLTGEYELAVKYYDKAIGYLDSIQNRRLDREILLMDCHHNLGLVLKMQGKTVEAALHFKNALFLAESAVFSNSPREYDIGSNSAELALCLSEVNRTEFQKYKEKAMPIVKKYLLDEHMADLYNSLLVR